MGIKIQKVTRILLRVFVLLTISTFQERQPNEYLEEKVFVNVQTFTESSRKLKGGTLAIIPVRN